MPSPSWPWSPLAAAAILLLLAGGCAPAASAPRSCLSSAGCSSSARCVAGMCVTNAPPSASITVPPGALETNLLLTFDGSASADRDPGDSIASYAWVLRAVAADCAPPVVAGNGPVANVRFGCPGTYAVELTVTDGMGATSVISREVLIAAYSGPALLAIGPDVVLGHACTAAPQHCAPTGSVALSAIPTAAAPPGLAFLWTVEPPPGRSLDANRRVAFDPGPDAPSPGVTIETDGQAISGDWIFRVEARDAAGVVASGAVRVSVGNGLPIIARTLPIPDHAFDGAQFTSSGEVPFTVTDPDGDELVGRTVEWRHVGDGAGGTFTGTVLDGPGRATFSIVVPYSALADAQHLIGGADLERSIRFSISDVNGGQAIGVWPVVVGNRPPVLVSEATWLLVDHVYDPVALAYRATAALSTWSDPDGDPLMPVPGASTGDPQCPQLDVVGGTSTASCSLAFTGTPAVANFAGSHLVSQHVQDPWVSAAAPSNVSFAIGNRAPSITATPVVLHTTCEWGACCGQAKDLETGLWDCVAWDTSWASGSTTVSGRWNDPDGDPLEVTLTGAPAQVCTPATCALTFAYGGNSVCAYPTTPDPAPTYATTATDGVSSASASITLDVTCP